MFEFVEKICENSNNRITNYTPGLMLICYVED